MKNLRPFTFPTPFAIFTLTMSAFFAFALLQAFAQTPMAVKTPLGLPPVPVPADNPMTEEKVELGKMLYFDKRLSQDNSVSCSTCHLPRHGYAEPRPVSIGIHDLAGQRNANPVINSAYATTLFWDGRVTSLEAQAAQPIQNPIEMGSTMEAVVEKLNNIEEYKTRFENVFGGPATGERITKAIAAFERTILSGNAPYDRYQNGEKDAMSEDAVAGMQLFNGKAMCSTCHTPPLFSNWNFNNAGIGMDQENLDLGRFEVTQNPADKGAFRVPHLRNASDTAPYFHDGSVESLEEAVHIMAGGGIDNPNRHAVFRAIEMQNLSEKDVRQLVEFIKALDGDYPRIEEPELP